MSEPSLLLYWTTAPPSYDGLTTRRTGASWGERIGIAKKVRWYQVEIKAANLSAQLGAYAGGNRGVMTDAEMQKIQEASR